MADGSAEFDGFVGRVQAALCLTSGAEGEVDQAYIRQVREERDRNLVSDALLVIGNAGTQPLDLPGHNICTADHNASQLEWGDPENPSGRRPCVNGDECVVTGTSGVLGTSMPPLPEFLNPTQKAAHDATGALPASQGRCLLCMRRDNALAVDLHTAGAAQSCIVAPVTNPVNTIGGYRLECTTSVYGNAISGGPVVRHYSGAEKMLTLEVNQQGRWRINEEKLLWHHPKC